MSEFKTAEDELVISTALKDASLDDFVVEDSDPEEKKRGKRIVEAIINGNEKVKDLNGLWLWGTNGTGKTLLQAILHNELQSRGKKVAWISPSEVKSTIYNTFGGGHDAHDIKSQILNSDYVFVDEVTLKNLSAGGVEAFKKFITELYDVRSRVKLICSANHDIDEVSESLQEGGRIVSTDNMGSVTDVREVSALVTNRIQDRLSELCVEVPLNYESHRSKIQRQQRGLLDEL